MTWKEFKDSVESQGVKDEAEIDFIDISGFDDEVVATTQPEFGVGIV